MGADPREEEGSGSGSRQERTGGRSLRTVREKNNSSLGQRRMKHRGHPVVQITYTNYHQRGRGGSSSALSIKAVGEVANPLKCKSGLLGDSRGPLRSSPLRDRISNLVLYAN